MLEHVQLTVRDCGEGDCPHPFLRVPAPTLDFFVCTGDAGEEEPHNHAALHSHVADGAGSVPALHLDRGDAVADGVDDDHVVEGHVVVTWLNAITAQDADGFLEVVTLSGVDLLFSVHPEDAAAALDEYGLDEETEVVLLIEAD